MTRNTASLLAVLALGFVLSPAVNADPPADKGKGQSASQPAVKAGSSQSAHSPADDAHGQGKNQAKEHGKGDADDMYDPYHDKYQGAKEDSNHGQRVSDCNHRANGKQMKGQERKAYVEWCVDNGERYKYDDKRWTSSRSCYQKADDRNLSGEARRFYINSCLTNSVFK